MNHEEVLARACKHFAVTASALASSGRTTYVSRARRVTMWCVRRRCRMSSTEIARMFKQRHHSTVLKACEFIDEAIVANDALVIEAIVAILGPQVLAKEAANG